MRLFIAIPLPEDAAARAFAILPDVLPGLRRVRPENLHLTLAFLGWTPDERLPDAEAAAKGAAAKVTPFRIALDRAGRFPERGRPRVVWLGIGQGVEDVGRVGAGVAAGLRARSLRFDERPLSPHLTLARAREDAGLPEARTAAAAFATGTAKAERLEERMSKTDLSAALNPKSSSPRMPSETRRP